MRKVITISLNGNAYQVEEGGYDALHAYLEGARVKLRDDPGCSEIVADLEQAVAEKCNHFLSSRKTVITSEEIAQVLREMGPVVGESSAAPGASGTAGTTGGSGAGGAADASAESASDGIGKNSSAGDGAAPKRLYRIHEGAVIGGVCTGLAAFLGADVAIVRIIFVALGLLTWGGAALVYIILMFAIPRASTSEDHAAAHGLPFTAEQLVEQAKRQYESFKNKTDWKQWQRHERARQRQWRREWRRGSKAMRDFMHPGPGPQWGPNWQTPPPNASAASYVARVVAGIFIPIFAIIHAVLLVALIVAIAQFATSGTVFGWLLPPGIPVWFGILLLVIVYGVIAGPMRAAYHSIYTTHSPTANAWFAVWGGILWLGFVAVFCWLAYTYWPDVQQFIQYLAETIGQHRRHVPAGSINLLDYSGWSAPLGALRVR